MVYSKEDLLKFIDENDMILLSRSVKNTSIQLKIDNKICLRNDTKPLIIADYKNLTKEVNSRFIKTELAKGIFFEPNNLMYGKSFETISIPDNACGLIIPAPNLSVLGITLTNTQILSPGYRGNPTLIFKNDSPVSVEIPPYFTVASLLILELKNRI